MRPRRAASSALLHSRGLSPRTLALTLSAWRGWYHWLVRQHGFSANPRARHARAEGEARRCRRRSRSTRAQRLLEGEEGATADMARDRAMFELLYSSGLAAGRAGGARTSTTAGSISRQGGGDGHRQGLEDPHRAGRRAGARGAQGLDRKRNGIAAAGEKALFVGARGRRISPAVVGARLAAWARRRGLAEQVHPHMLRHSFASHVLQSSQDLRAVQEMLGHASISTTQVYTHLDFQALAKVYDAAHPRAKKK